MQKAMSKSEAAGARNGVAAPQRKLKAAALPGPSITGALRVSRAAQTPQVSAAEATLTAIGKSQAMIEFQMDGTIVTANDNFLKAIGYTLGEIQGRHHSTFLELAHCQAEDYRNFWAALARGEFQSVLERRRAGKSGADLWLQSTFNPIPDGSGRPCKVISLAIDVTKEKLAEANFSGQVAAINKSLAVAEFQMDGTILHANEAFLKALGYTLGEIVGQHQSILVEEGLRHSEEYRNFWAALNRGEYRAGEFKRMGKNGREVWLQSAFNPILDAAGKPFKVVNFATDVTESRLRRLISPDRSPRSANHRR